MTDSSSLTHVALTPEQVALLSAAGAPVTSPHRSTVLRREARARRVFPVISRSGRTYRQPDGRPYGEVTPEAQRQADAK